MVIMTTDKLIALAEQCDAKAMKGPWKSDFCGEVFTISPDVPLDESEPKIGPIFQGIGATTIGPDAKCVVREPGRSGK